MVNIRKSFAASTNRTPMNSLPYSWIGYIPTCKRCPWSFTVRSTLQRRRPGWNSPNHRRVLYCIYFTAKSRVRWNVLPATRSRPHMNASRISVWSCPPMLISVIWISVWICISVARKFTVGIVRIVRQNVMRSRNLIYPNCLRYWWFIWNGICI